MSGSRRPLPASPVSRPPARDGITAQRVVLKGVVPEGEFFARPAGDSPFIPGQLIAPGTVLDKPVPAWTFPILNDEPTVPFHHDILARDEQLVVADKPHFLPTTSNGRLVRNTLQTRLRREFGEAVTPLHRLDRLTAGVVVCSLNPATRGRYQQLFQNRQVQKTYVARTNGELGIESTTVIRLGMTKRRGGRQVDVDKNGTETVTRLRSEGDIAYLEPVTGHTHQLRVVCAHLGAPIVGDDAYPVARQLALDDFDSPLHLVATGVRFVDPVSAVVREFRTRRGLPAILKVNGR